MSDTQLASIAQDEGYIGRVLQRNHLELTGAGLLSWMGDETGVGEKFDVPHFWDGVPFTTLMSKGETVWSYPSTIMLDRPVAYLRLGDEAGTTAHAEIGPDGTYGGTYELGHPNQVMFGTNGAVNLGPGGGWVAVAGDSGVDDLTLLSWEAWIKLDGDFMGTLRTIARKGTTNYLRVTTGDKAQVVLDIGGSPRTVSGSTTLAADTWYHVVATYNGSTIVLYLNGVSDGSQAQTGTLDFTGTHHIGVADDDPVTSPFDGVIDDYAVYDHVNFTPLDHYNAATVSQGGIIPPTLGVGTITDPGGTYTGRAFLITPLHVLVDASTVYGSEYRARFDANQDRPVLDAGPESALFNTTPQVLLTDADVDDPLRNVYEVLDVELEEHWREETTGLIVTGSGRSGEDLIVGNAWRRPQWKDWSGRSVYTTRVISNPAEPSEESAQEYANKQIDELNKAAEPVTTLTLLGTYRHAHFEPGDSVWVYVPSARLFGDVNTISGTTVEVPARAARVLSVTYPVRRGGAYVRRWNGQLLDVTEYLEWETSDTFEVEIGTALARPSLTETARSRPALEDVLGRVSGQPRIPVAPTLNLPFASYTARDNENVLHSGILVSWNDVRFWTNGDPLLGAVANFEVRWKLASASEYNYQPVPAGTFALNLYPLEPGASYSIGVSAIVSGARSAWIDTTQVATADTTPPSKPEPPVLTAGYGWIGWEHRLAKDGGADFSLEGDTSELRIYASTVSPVVVDDTTLVDVRTAQTFGGLQIPAIGGWDVTSLAQLFVVCTAVDRARNESAPSDEVTATPIAIDASQIADGAISQAKIATQLDLIQIVSVLPADNSNGDLAFLLTDFKLYRWDGAAWTRAVDGLDLVADTVTTGAIQAGAVTATELAADSVFVRHLVVADWQNAARDPGFELNDLSLFLSVDSGGTWSIAAADPLLDGNFALQYDTTGQTAAAALYLTSNAALTAGVDRHFKVQPGERVRVSIDYLLVSGATANRHRLRIRWYESDGTFISDSQDSLVTPTGARQTVAYETDAPAGAAYGVAGIQQLSEGNVCVVQWDNASVRVMTSGVVIKDGTIIGDKIAAATITGAKISALTITAANIQAGTITGDKIAANTIDAVSIKTSTLSVTISLSSSGIFAAPDTTATKRIVIEGGTNPNVQFRGDGVASDAAARAIFYAGGQLVGFLKGVDDNTHQFLALQTEDVSNPDGMVYFGPALQFRVTDRRDAINILADGVSQSGFLVNSTGAADTPVNFHHQFTLPTDGAHFVISGIGVSSANYHLKCLTNIGGSPFPAFGLRYDGVAEKSSSGTAWVSTSDERLKVLRRAVAPRDAIDRLERLQVRHFKWRASAPVQGRGAEEFGVTAQNYRDSYPDWVDERGDGTLQLDPSLLQWDMLVALQDVLRRLDVLESN